MPPENRLEALKRGQGRTALIRILEEFLELLGIGQNLLARETGMSPRRINEIVLGKRAITGDTAIRLGRFLGLEP